MNILELIGRRQHLFDTDLERYDDYLRNTINNSRILIIGAAGSIGQAVTREIFSRNPRCLHALDISENNLVELVRQLRSTTGYIDGEFKTFLIDCGSEEYHAFVSSSQNYDYILNLSAVKHVRSEKDPFSLMRMIKVNIFNTINSVQLASKTGVNKYFCVSTDKAANPVNMMGASKRIMEMFLARESDRINISTARFANVAFSDGSLLNGFTRRLVYKQPISAPVDVQRYFVTPEESGHLCLMSTFLGANMETFFPKESEDFNLTRFSDIAVRFLRSNNYEPYYCDDEEEARRRMHELLPKGKWPVYFFNSDTTGEKSFEEFYTRKEKLDLDRFSSIGVIHNTLDYDEDKLSVFEKTVNNLASRGSYHRQDFIDLFKSTLVNFSHMETGRFLDDRM